MFAGRWQSKQQDAQRETWVKRFNQESDASAKKN